MKNSLESLFNSLKSLLISLTRRSDFRNSSKGSNNLFYPPYSISDTSVGDFTYIATNSRISFSEIGKFCSIGPNFLCGFGVHPLNWISTHPIFYSTRKQNGTTFSNIDKIEERKKIIIWNDVFIGANVTILDGVKIGDGAVIWAGAVVSKDIPPYAVAVGCPIVIKRFRFDDATINKLLHVKWWDFEQSELKFVEKYFFDIEVFFDRYDN